MSQLINFSQGHSTVIGITRSGKTYATKKSLENVKEGVLFFNTQLEEMPKIFIKCDADTNISVMINALKQGKKINYIPNWINEEFREKEVVHLVRKLYQSNIKKIYFVVDEVHLYNNLALKELIKVATTGLRFGIYGIWISQRPANIDNTLMTQSNQFIIFDTNMESGYFKRYGIPADEIKERIGKGGKYSYCTYNFKEVRGPFKV